MKVTRITNLITEKIGYELWRLHRELMYVVGGIRITVPQNFITDGASCPRILWSLCDPMAGPQAEAAVLHDYLYSKDSKMEFSRLEADDIFYAAMLANGTGSGRAWLIYKGVRVGGSGSYKACYSVSKIK